jgi:hypothetical protein
VLWNPLVVTMKIKFIELPANHQNLPTNIIVNVIFLFFVASHCSPSVQDFHVGQLFGRHVHFFDATEFLDGKTNGWKPSFSYQLCSFKE